MHLLRYLVMMVLVCPAMADTTAPASPAEVTVPAIAGQDAVSERRAALEQRVIAKWDALIKNDFATAYTFTSPAYRQRFSLEAFKGQFSTGRVVWRRIEVVDVDFKGDDAAMVGINIHFVYHQAQTAGAIDMANYVQEPWVRVDGQWWYLAKG